MNTNTNTAAVVLGEESVVATAVGLALANASSLKTSKPRKTGLSSVVVPASSPSGGSSAGVDINSLLTVQTMSTDEMAALANQAKQFRELVIKGSNEALPAIEAEIDRLTAPDGWEDVPAIAEAVKRLRAQQSELLAKIGPARAEFARLVALVQSVQTFAEFTPVIERLTSEKTDENGSTRYHQASFEEVKSARNGGAKLPLGWFQANGKTYAPFVPPAGEPKSSAQKCIEAETVKAATRCRKYHAKIAHERTQVLLADENIKWTLGDELVKEGDHVTGLYGHKFEGSREGCLVVRFSRIKGGDATVEPWDGSGDFIRFSELRVKFGLPIKLARRGMVPDHFPAEFAGHARLLASLLNEALKR